MKLKALDKGRDLWPRTVAQLEKLVAGKWMTEADAYHVILAVLDDNHDQVINLQQDIRESGKQAR